MYDTIIESLREYFLTCPLIGSSEVNIDFLPETGAEYSIDTLAAEDTVKQYINGDEQKQYLFAIRSVNSYGSDVAQNLANSAFFEQLSVWIDEQTDAENYPALPSGLEPQSLTVISTGYLLTAGTNIGKYQIECRLTYLQKG